MPFDTLTHQTMVCVRWGKNVTNGATNGQGDSRSRIHGDSFAWSRWNSMCSPKTLSGIVFLPHQSKLIYVETGFSAMWWCGIQCSIPKRCQNRVVYHTHHSYNMLKRLLLQCVAVEFLCELPKRFQKSCIYHKNHNQNVLKGILTSMWVVVFSNDSLNRLPW